MHIYIHLSTYVYISVCLFECCGGVSPAFVANYMRFCDNDQMISAPQPAARLVAARNFNSFIDSKHDAASGVCFIHKFTWSRCHNSSILWLLFSFSFFCLSIYSRIYRTYNLCESLPSASPSPSPSPAFLRLRRFGSPSRFALSHSHTLFTTGLCSIAIRMGGKANGSSGSGDADVDHCCFFCCCCC